MEIDRNRMNYMNASRVRQDSSLAEEWKNQQALRNPQGQNRQQATGQSNLGQPNLGQAQKKMSMRQSQSASRANSISRVQSVQAISKIDEIDAVDGIEAIGGNQRSAIDFKDAARFDMKEDIADFVRPKHMPAEYIRKDTLNKTAQRVLMHLQASGASESLIKRATMLLEEEGNVKSITDAYKNALVFA